MMRSGAFLLVLAAFGVAVMPGAASARTCDDYSSQAEAQRGGDTRDADGDGIYCESLPCPCSRQQAPSDPGPAKKRSCTKPAGIQSVVFSAARYPNIRKHFLSAVRAGWPRTLVLHRRKTAFRRQHLLDDYPPRKGFDRDEYPPAVGRESWRADVAYVPSRENRSHGASLGAQLRRFCHGTRFQYVFD